MRVFAVRDLKAEQASHFFGCPNAAVAVRLVQSWAEEQGHPYNQFPEDYVLFEIGGYDPSEMGLEPQLPYEVCKLADLIQATPPKTLPTPVLKEA